MRSLTWKLPSIRPRYVERSGVSHWKVMPDKALGKARAVCVPVGLEPAGWTLKLASPGAPIQTTLALTERWTELAPAPAAAGASHLLCLLGYDQAPDGSGGTFAVDPFGAVMPAALQDVIAKLESDLGRTDLADWLMPADPPAPAAAPAPLANTPPGAAGAVAAPAAASLTLAFVSCQYPSGLLDKLPAQQSYERLLALLNTPGARTPSVLLLLGDQVYVDATAGLLDPVRLDDRYRVPYEELAKIEPMQRILQARLRAEWMLDDHEIADNWEPRRPGDTGDLYRKGLAAYWSQQRTEAAQPPPSTWSSFQASKGWALFMADTRTLRDFRCEATLSSAQILGAQQRTALEQWLLAVPPNDLKLIASPAMLLPRLVEHMDEPLHLDCWQGYPSSLHGLLAFLCDHQIPNVHFLSGDAHIGSDVVITVTGNGKTVTTRSTHAPALYAPLPFANTQPWHLVLPQDSFHFPDPVAGPYTCTVAGNILLPRGDGSCLLKADRAGSVWTVTTQVV